MSISSEYILSHVFPNIFKYDKKYDELTMEIKFFNLYSYELSIREIFYKLYPIAMQKHKDLSKIFTMKQYEELLLNDKDLEYLDEENIDVSKVLNITEPTKTNDLKIEYTKFNKLLYNDFKFLKLENPSDIKHYKIENIVCYNNVLKENECWNVNYYLENNLKTIENILYLENIEYVLTKDLIMINYKHLNPRKIILRFINDIEFMIKLFNILQSDLNNLYKYQNKIINYCENIKIIPELFNNTIMRTNDVFILSNTIDLIDKYSINYDVEYNFISLDIDDNLHNCYVKWCKNHDINYKIVKKINIKNGMNEIIDTYTKNNKMFPYDFMLEYLTLNIEDVKFVEKILLCLIYNITQNYDKIVDLKPYFDIFNSFTNILKPMNIIPFMLSYNAFDYMNKEFITKLKDNYNEQYETIIKCIQYKLKNIVEITKMLNINPENIKTLGDITIAMAYIIVFKEEPPFEYYHSPRININGKTLENVWRHDVCSDIPKEMTDIRFYEYMIKNNGKKSPENITAVYTYFSNSEEMKIIIIDDKNLLLEPAKKRFTIEIDYETIKTFITEEIDTNDICLFGRLNKKDWEKLTNGNENIDVIILTDIKDVYRHRTPLKMLLEFLKSNINIKFNIEISDI